MTDNGWHLDKRVSVGHIATTLVVGAAALTWLYTIDGRSKLNEQQISQLTQIVSSHAAIPVHRGALEIAGDVKALTVEINALKDVIEKLDHRLQRQWDEINRRRPP